MVIHAVGRAHRDVPQVAGGDEHAVLEGVRHLDRPLVGRVGVPRAAEHEDGRALVAVHHREGVQVVLGEEMLASQGSPMQSLRQGALFGRRLLGPDRIGARDRRVVEAVDDHRADPQIRSQTYLGDLVGERSVQRAVVPSHHRHDLVVEGRQIARDRVGDVEAQLVLEARCTP